MAKPTRNHALPGLWVDWCAATGTPVNQLNQVTLDRFRHQSRPPQTLLRHLVPKVAEPGALAWPVDLRQDKTALTRLICSGSSRISNPDLDWITRLRLRRLVFAAVLIAPVDLGGLSLDRKQTRRLTPARFQELRPQVGYADDEASCPACAVWSWLEILGTNSKWSRGTVKALGRRRDDHGETHRHQRADPCPDWMDWPEQSNLLPAIDRWGYLDQYESMHPSSLSVLIRTMVVIAEAPVVEFPLPEPVPAPPTRYISPEEEAKILSRADELNACVAKILREYG